MCFSTAGSWEKDTENGAPGNFFGPSYFETALHKCQINGEDFVNFWGLLRKHGL